MASTSNSPPTTASSTASGLEDDLLTLYRNQLRSDSRDQPSVVMHPKLRRPARCRNCRHIEDLESAPIAMLNTGEGEHAVHLLEPDIEHPPPEAVTPAAPHRLSLLQGNSCFRCVKEMYEKTGSLQELPPAGSGGDTPLHHAARCGNLRMLYHLITLLREGGVHHDRAVKAVAMRNDNGETALHIAVSVGSIEIVELLLWVHPQLCRLTCFNISPIYLAVSLGRSDIAKALHDASSTGISYSGPNRQNALHAAAFYKNDMTQMILTWNKDLAKDKDDNGRTPLHFAVSMPQRRSIYICYFCLPWRLRECDSVRQLLQADSSMAYEEDNEGLFPIHVAAITHEWSSVDILVKRCPGCMDLRDNQGRTFLHVAVQNEAVFIVKCVCRRPEFAQILNIQDKNGNTALHLAVDVQNLLVLCHLLKNRGVILNLRNRENETALDVAKRRMIRKGYFYWGNPEYLIYLALVCMGAEFGHHLWDRLTAKSDSGRPTGLAEREEPAEDLESSAVLADSTRTLGIGSVLIASVTFAAVITRVPGPGGSSNNQQAGTGTDNAARIARSWYFEAFMIANALAFICASAATIGLMYSGMAMVTLHLRIQHFERSVMLATCSVMCLTAAFSLGVYMVLAPVARFTAILVSAICPLVVIYKMAQGVLLNLAFISGALLARREFLPLLLTTVCLIIFFFLLTMLQ